MNSTGLRFLANSPRSTKCPVQGRVDSRLILIFHQREVDTHRLRLGVDVSHVAIYSAGKNSAVAVPYQLPNVM